MFDWNDLQFFLAVARVGSTLAASRQLDVDQSTVRRRVAELERRLGQPLMQREPTGYQLTQFGRAMLEQTKRIEHAVRGFEQHAQAVRDGGVVRVTCPEPIVTRLLASSILDRFRAKHPDIRVEFVMSDHYMDLSKGDADVALRSGDTDDGDLVGRKIGDSLWAVYASHQYIKNHGRPQSTQDLVRHALIGFDDSMAKHRAALWTRQVVPDANVVVRSGSVLGVPQSAKAGMGVAALPMPIGDADPELERLFGPVDALTRIWRVLTPVPLRHTPRVSAFFDFIAEEIEALKPILTG